MPGYILPSANYYTVNHYDHNDDLSLQAIVRNVYNKPDYEGATELDVSFDGEVIEYRFESLEKVSTQLGYQSDLMEKWIQSSVRLKEEPTSASIIAHLIFRGHLPHGRYLIKTNSYPS